jgi:DNA polymerase I-like protein with 3'-5' exonuclease and polymerase domains
MTLIQTETLRPNSLGPSANLQTYCGLDCCVTYEVWEEIRRLRNEPPAIYSFERALQAPYLEIMQRGFLVDEISRRQATQHLHQRVAHLTEILNELASAIWDKGLNPRSPLQLKDFFYSRMKLPEVWISQKGQRKLSTNREALEKLEQYLYARPFVSLILSIRELAKQLEVFETEIDPDSRYRTSYNIAGTETGRPSSSENAFGTGGNAQNIAPGLRYIFVADSRRKLCVIDLEQVEARDVGFFVGCLFNDWDYLNAAESGDMHTVNARLIWPHLDWTRDLKKDREIANRLFYRDFTYRDMAKRGSHLTNYSGTAWTASRHLKVPIEMMEEFQARYVRGRVAEPAKGILEIQPAFPGIARWWQWVAQELQTTQQLITPFGRSRHFFGRPGDSTTIREAIAFLPQSTTADRMNLGLWRVWKYMPEVRLLAQTYDSITFDYEDRGHEYETEIIGRALELCRVELRAPNGRSYVVPGEAKIGWNWGNETTQSDIDRAIKQGKRAPRLNTEGLRKFSFEKPDTRQRAVGLRRIMT